MRQELAPARREPEVVTVKEFAARYGLSLPAAYAHVARRNIRTVRLGRRILIPRDALPTK